MTNTIEQLLVLYEIAMSIGSSLDLRPMLKNSLALLLKKLTCSAGGVLFFRPGPISSLALNVLQEIHSTNSSPKGLHAVYSSSRERRQIAGLNT